MQIKILLLSLAVMPLVNYSQAQNKNINTAAEKWFAKFCNEKKALKNSDGNQALKIAGAGAANITANTLQLAEDNATAPEGGFFDVISPKRKLRPVMLPVKILNFSAECYSNQVVLSWSTFAEDHNDCFIIEKSVNGTDWSKVAMVKGIGKDGETNYYTLSDYEANDKTYYRLNKGTYDPHMTYYHVVMGNEN